MGFTNSIPDRYRWAWNRLLPIIKPAIAFEFWFSLLYVTVFTTLSAWLLNRLLVSSGQFAISDYDLITFFLSGRGILYLLLSATFALVLGFAELVGLLMISMDAAMGRKAPVSDTLWENIRHIPALIRLGLIQAGGYAVLSIPFIGGIAATYRIFLWNRDINYYLSTKPFEWWAALLIAGILVVAFFVAAAWIFVRWLFAVPFLIFEKTSPVRSLRQSWHYSGKRFWDPAIPLALLWLTVIFGSVSTTWLIQMLAGQILAGAELKLIIVLPTVLGALAATALLDFAWIIFGKIFQSLLIICFYLDFGKTPETRNNGHPGPGTISPSMIRKLGWVAAAIALSTAISSGVVFIEKLNLKRDIAVTAHRGSSMDAPENTLSAVRKAISDTADYAEIDVQATSDGVVVLIHDGDLMRIAAVDRKINEISFDELMGIDIGSWFSPAFRNERMAKLTEVIDAARNHIKLNIELKYNRPDPVLAEKVVGIIREKSFAGQCLVSSLDYRALMAVKRMAPEIKTGFIVSYAIGKLDRTQTEVLSVSAAQATAALVRKAHRLKKEIHVWTVNDLHHALSMIEIGVDNIITDRPKAMRRLLDAWINLSDTEKVALMLRNFFNPKGLPKPENL
jgi:glycerophosphoryl diester phosphodiesterase